MNEMNYFNQYLIIGGNMKSTGKKMTRIFLYSSLMLGMAVQPLCMPVFAEGETVAAQSVNEDTFIGPSVVTPVNELLDTTFDTNAAGFINWRPTYAGEEVGAMSKDGAGSFILGKGVTAKQINGNGLSIWTDTSNQNAWLSQSVSVVKGETYRFSFTANRYNSMLDAVGVILYKIGDQEIQEVEADGQSDYYFDYTAPETKEIEVSLGARKTQWLSLRATTIDYTNLTLMNTDVTVPARPNVNNIFTDKNIVTGSAEPHTTIVVKTEDNQLFEGETDDTGAYTIQIARQIAGQFIEVYNKDVAGNVSEMTRIQVRQGELMTPVIDDVTNDSTEVKGKADLAVSVQVKIIKADQTENVYVGNTDNKGNYSVAIPKPKYGETVRVTTSATGKTSSAAEASVKDVIMPDIPTVEKVYTDTLSIVGKGTAGNKISVILPNGKELTTDVDEDGSFKIDMPAQVQDAVILVKQIKPSGLAGEAALVTVLPGDLPKPVVNELTNETTTIKGTATPNARLVIAVKNEDGTTVKEYTGTVDSSGNFAFLVDQLQAEYTVSINSTLDTQRSKELILSVKDVIAPERPQVNKVTDASRKVSGKTEANAAILISANGTEIAKGTADENGDFVVTIPYQNIKQVLSVVAVDQAGNKSEEVELIVEESQGTAFPTDFVLGSTTIVGSYEGDVDHAQLVINDKAISWGGNFKEGSFTYYVGNKVKAGDKVKLVLYSSRNKKLSETTVTIKSANKQGKLIANIYTIGDLNLTGTYTGDIAKARLVVNGKTISWGGNFVSGKFSYYAGQSKIKAGDTVELIGYSDYDEELDKQTVELASNVTDVTITPDSFKLGTTFITGIYTGDVALASLSVNGNVVSFGGDFANGAFTYYVGNRVKAGDEVKLTFFTSLKEKIIEKTIELTEADSQGELAPDEYMLGTSELKGSFSGDISKAKLVINKKTISWGGSFKEGKFTYFVGNRIKENDTVVLEAYDKNDKLLDSKTVTLKAVQALKSVTLNPYTIGEQSITGTYEGTDVKIASLLINGKRISWGGNFDNGQFSYYTGSKIKAGATVEIEFFDGSNKLALTKEVEVKD